TGHHQWLNINSRLFSNDQNTSSKAFFLSGSAAISVSRVDISRDVGLRLRQRIYSSSMICACVFFSVRRLPIRLPSGIFRPVVSPLSRCSDCDKVGSSRTSQEQTVSRTGRPKVVRK